MPIIRFTQTYLNYISNPKNNQFIKLLFHLSFILPFIIYISYFNPLIRDFIVPEDMIPCNNDSYTRDCKINQTDDF